MELQGYCRLSKNSNCSHAMGELDAWRGRTVRVMEFARDGAVLVVDATGTKMGQFEAEDVTATMRCTEMGGVVIPPDLNEVARSIYMTRAITRIGGYNKTLASMVVEASLMRGEFYDKFLWNGPRTERQKTNA